MGLRGAACCAVLAISCWAALAPNYGLAEDWPTFRHDIARSGISGEKLALPLSPCWTHVAPFWPQPAFGTGYPHHTNWEGGVEKRRIDFDRADSAVVAGGSVYFGSGGDGRVYCLDAKTAQVKWSFPTGGPVRLSPTIADGKVFFGSDDGWVYCLSAADGAIVWKFRAAPDDLRIIGNGHLISLWPVRTGVLVDGGICYFAAGVFPTEGVILYAADSQTGKVLWKNDQASEIRLSQISPQGHLLASKDRLIVPMSRQAPGVYDRATGKMQRRLSIYFGGGTFAVLGSNCLYTGCEAAQCFPLDSQQPNSAGTSHTLAGFPGGQLVCTADRVFSCGMPKGEGVSKSVEAYEWKAPAKAPTEEELRRGQATAPPPPKVLWSCPFENPECIILAGDTLFVGGPSRVAAINPADGKIGWSAEIKGSALSLAVSDSRLYVSTDAGAIHCFGPAGSAAPAPAAVADPPVGAQWKQAADAIVKQAPQAKKGFALVYGVETGELAIELARRTELKIHAVSPDAAKVALARKRVEAAGLYGGRIVIEQWPLDKVPYTQYFADLVVSETAVLTNELPGTPAEVFRMTKPIRGAVMLGRPTADAALGTALTKWLAGSPLADAKVVSDGGTWASFTRPRLAGAMPWTHQYAGPGGTASSDDQLVKAPLRVQWFGDPGPAEFVDRHYWGAAPLAFDGRMFCCTYKDVTAYDVYNGTKLWSHALANATRAHIADVPSNVAVGPEGYFVAVDDVCYRLDPATGEKLSQFKVPDAADGKRRMWGYVACVDGVLVGSRTLGYLSMEKWRKSHGEQVSWWLLSDLLFAMDAKTGKVLWQYPTEWFRHNSVVVGPSTATLPATVYLSHPGGTPEQQQAAVAEARPAIDAYPAKEKQGAQKALAKPYTEMLAALDLKTGVPRWQRVVDWSVCGGDRGTLIFKNGLLMLMSDVGGCKAWSGYGLEEQLGRSVEVRDAATGALKWLKALNHRSRAVVVEDRIYGEPWAFDLATGQQRMMKHPISGEEVPWMFMRAEKHCGPFNASAHMLFFRNGGFGYVDVDRNEGVSRFESTRPNCWMSFISAEGLALWPSGDAGCRCDLAISCSVAMVHDERSRVFGDFACTGPITPVKQLALNFGAAGDRRDAAGKLWFSYPRVKFTSAVELPIKADFQDGGGVTMRNATWNDVAGTPNPWVYTSSAAGMKRMTLSLRKPADAPANYTVELSFAAPPGDQPGGRVFDVKLQGQVVKAGLDIVQEAGGADKALTLKFDHIPVKEDLVLEFVPRTNTLPLICGMEMTQQQ
ncbi:MAG: PQQ-binding-like beta-propeller repeat protein [Planctomycetia bacterium]|nr:PQQ-binding-like beta-propeller repeat protein [Planctomycetia bacterium]